jgi:hypothetical protein
MKVALMMSLPVALAATPALGVLAGDCNENGRVTIDELVTCVDIELGNVDGERCPALECQLHGEFLINCLIEAVDAALSTP